MKRHIVTMAFLAIAGTGCAANGPSVGEGRAPEADWITVLVENETGSTLRISAFDRGAETPIGRVQAMSTSSLRIPGYTSPTIQLIARPSVNLAPSRAHFSDPIAVRAGQGITWRLLASPATADVPRLSTVKMYICDGARGC
jgi:hypothetical protein